MQARPSLLIALLAATPPIAAQAPAGTNGWHLGGGVDALRFGHVAVSDGAPGAAAKLGPASRVGVHANVGRALGPWDVSIEAGWADGRIEARNDVVAIEAEMLEARLPREKVVYLPHGVDTGRFLPAAPDERLALRARLGLPAEGNVVIWTGRLLRGKGLETLLTAFARVAAADPRALLVLVGSGEGQALSVEAELRAQAEQRPLAGRVAFTGAVDDVAPWLRAADVFAFPSEFEALGLSLLEAAGFVDVRAYHRRGYSWTAIGTRPADAAG